jgi:hypothetical protein
MAYGLTLVHSVVDPKLFITDPEPSSYRYCSGSGKSSGSGSGSTTLVVHVEVRFVPKFDTLAGKIFLAAIHWANC